MPKHVLSPEARQKISESLKRTLSAPEEKKRLSEQMKGRKLSEETRTKMCESQRHRRATTVVSEETRKRQSLAITGRNIP